MSILKRVLRVIAENELIGPGETVVVGVSGGPDSLALLHLLRELAPTLGIHLHVAHLDHQLRGAESDADAAFVAEIAREWDLPATVEARPVAAVARWKSLSVEEAARVVRYEFLAETAQRVGARTVAVAHNADDQAETVLMHILRGSGLSGLRGMLYKSPLPAPHARLSLVRPLLKVTRAEIQVYCREHRLEPRLDQSNLDTTIFRNRLRHEVIPYLERFNPNLREVLRHTAQSIADDYNYLQTQLVQAFGQVARPVPNAFVFNRPGWQELPPSLQRATLREAVRTLRRGLRNVNWAHIEDARRVALTGQVGAEATLPQGLMLVVGYDEFTLGETVLLPDWPLLHGGMMVLVEGMSDLPGSEWRVAVTLSEMDPSDPERSAAREPVALADRWSAILDADKISGQLVLRPRRPGDRFQPSGLGGHVKSLHDFMINEKLARPVRDLVPILADDEKIVWVCGYRADERAIVTQETRRALRVKLLKQDYAWQNHTQAE